MPETSFKLPPSFLVLNGVAMLFLIGGILGLVMPETLPPLASPAVAWSLISVGVILDLFAVAQLLRAVKAANSAR
jgi:hypothetical protein